MLLYYIYIYFFIQLFCTVLNLFYRIFNAFLFTFNLEFWNSLQI